MKWIVSNPTSQPQWAPKVTLCKHGRFWRKAISSPIFSLSLNEGKITNKSIGKKGSRCLCVSVCPRKQCRLAGNKCYPHTHAHTSRAPYVAGNLASLQIVQILNDSQLWRKFQVNVCVASSEKECCTAWNCLPSTMHKDGESLFTRQ